MANSSKALILCLFFAAFAGAYAQSSTVTIAALTGIVSSQKVPLEGVLVSAKKMGGTITITVVSDSHGRFSFPKGRLQAGRYRLRIRASGYELASPVVATLEDGKPAVVNLSLTRTRELAANLMSAEWLVSIPGSEAQKKSLYRCINCHTLFPIVKSSHNAVDWDATVARMESYISASTLLSPVISPVKPQHKRDPDFELFLASINLHNRSQWEFPLKTFDRPSGQATRVIVTEYDLPSENSLPHDAVVGRDGMIWFDDFQRPIIGRLNPSTGEVKEWKMPLPRPGSPEGSLALRVDQEGNVWVPRFLQGCTVTEFNPTTEEFKSWTVPAQYNNAIARCGHVAFAANGKMWLSDSENRRMFLFDPHKGDFEVFDSFPNYSGPTSNPVFGNVSGSSQGHRTYEIAADSRGNGYFADIGGSTIGRVDAKTGHVTLYPTPTPNSGPRRCFMDSEDRLWFGENYANKLGMLDTKTGTIKEFVPPIPWNGAYPAFADGRGDIWTAGMSTDFVFRLKPSTGQFVSYLLPTLGANVRNIDGNANSVLIWVAEVHAGKIALLEPLD